MRTRRLISATLLLLQAFGLHHLALSAHDFDSSGAAYEHAALINDSHSDEGGHVCADAGVVSESAESCPVVASWLTASRVGSVRVALRAPSLLVETSEVARVASPPVALLSLAPKSSPPAS
ncbi:MAG: hypothetical protein QM817_38030 [Archangium sp.]